MQTKYQVFISSTFDDLQEERMAIWQSLTDHGYIVADMENFPSTSDDPFEYIKPLISDSDYFLLIIGDRYGSDFGTTGKSYTETEFDYALESDVPVLVFPVDVAKSKNSRKSDIDQIRASRLEAFRARASTGRMIRTWTSPESLASVVVQALSFESGRKPRPGWVRGGNASSLKLFQENSDLRSQLQETEEKLSREPDMTLEGMRELLKTPIRIHARHKINDHKESHDFSIGRILRLESPFKDASFSSLKSSIEIVFCNVVGKKNDDFSDTENFNVNEISVDRFLLLLRRHNIIRFGNEEEPERIYRGKNWILAIEAAALAILDGFPEIVEAPSGTED